MPAAAAPAEEGDDGDCDCGTDGYACYGVGGGEVVVEGRGSIGGGEGDWGRDCGCHVGFFL